MSLNNYNSAAACPTQSLIPLGRLSLGRRATIADVVGRADQVQRLKELGLNQGVVLDMVRPGNPCIVRLHSRLLCIRGNEMVNVLVQPGDEP